jgi:hypothetical protein
LRREDFVRAVFIVILLLIAVAPARAQNAADYELGCDGAADTRWCKIQLADFRKWFPLAMRGDYQGQRNVAFCLSEGCDGAIVKKPITACAWRMVIVGSGSPKVDQGDTANLKNACGRLDETERQAAAAQATTLLAKIPRR